MSQLSRNDFREILLQVFKSHDFDPLKEMIVTFKEHRSDLTTKDQLLILNEMSSYLYPKLKSITVDSKTDTTFTIKLCSQTGQELGNAGSPPTINVTPQASVPLPGLPQDDDDL